jgi:hypothetical protein
LRSETSLTRVLWRRTLPLVLIVVALAACGTTDTASSSAASSAPATPTPSPTPNFAKTFTDADIGRLVLQASDGPSSIPYSISGASTVAQFWDCCPPMQTKWTADGFVKLAGGHFQSPSAKFTDGTNWPAGPGIVFSFAVIFHDAAGATQGMKDWENESASGSSRTPIAGLQELGPDAVGTQYDGGQLPKGSVQTFDYFWRVGNVGFSVTVSGKTGTLSETDARKFADAVNAHALR